MALIGTIGLVLMFIPPCRSGTSGNTSRTWGPKGLPRDIVMLWNKEVAKVLRTEAMQKWFEREGMEPAGGSPEEFRDRIKSDLEKWKKVVKDANFVIGS